MFFFLVVLKYFFIPYNIYISSESFSTSSHFGTSGSPAMLVNIDNHQPEPLQRHHNPVHHPAPLPFYSGHGGLCQRFNCRIPAAFAHSFHSANILFHIFFYLYANPILVRTIATTAPRISVSMYPLTCLHFSSSLPSSSSNFSSWRV